MDLEEVGIVCLIIGCASLVVINKKKQPRHRRWWVRPWILKREQHGVFRLCNEEFENAQDNESFKNFIRMDRQTFTKLLNMVEQDITKQCTLMRSTISAKQRLILTLRFLATGESFQSLQYTFRIGKSTISTIVPEVCAAIYRKLKKKYLKVPTTSAEWLNIAEEFYKQWNFPNTLGALDGKHIVFRAPSEAGSAYHNYKQQDSIVLLAVADATYKFTYIDCGTNGRVSDGGVFQRSTLAAAIRNNSLNFPEERPLPGQKKPVPFVLVADAAFPLQQNIMKPFPYKNMTWHQRIFNYRLSRARRVVENAFGILSNRWRVLLTPIKLNVDEVQLITETCCVLHNFLLIECPPVSMPDRNEEEGSSFKFCFGLSQQGGNRPRGEALNIRNEFMNFVNTEGAVPWQNNCA